MGRAHAHLAAIIWAITQLLAVVHQVSIELDRYVFLLADRDSLKLGLN